jgi:hypothetical protein
MVGVESWDCVTFPKGDRLIYVEVPGNEGSPVHHTYWRATVDEDDVLHRGRQLAGASTMVASFDDKDSDGLHKWIARRAAESGDTDPGKEKRDLGTRVHAAAEALARGEGFPDLSTAPDSDLGYLRALMRWWEERRPDVLAYEQFVYHGDLGYAGRYDLRAVVDGQVTLLDYKTAKYLYPKYGAQLVAYNHAAQWCGLGAADRLLILKLNPDGTWNEVPAFVTTSEFLRALGVRSAASRVRKLQQDWLRVG